MDNDAMKIRLLGQFSADKYMLKSNNNRSTRKRCGICLNLISRALK